MIRALTKLASVYLPVMAVSLLFSSQFATANDVAAGAAESMTFKASPQSVTADQYLNSISLKPQPGAVAAPGATPAVTGKALSWGVPNVKKPAGKKDDQNNQMANQLGNLLGGGGGAPGAGGGNRGGAGAAGGGNYADSGKYSDNSKSEGGYCPTCNSTGSHNGTSGIDMNKVEGYVNADSVKELSAKEKCYAKYLEAQLPDSFSRSPFKSRTRSGGDCALGVRMLLSDAGMTPEGLGLGHAINFASDKDMGIKGKNLGGSMGEQGFRKVDGLTAQTAPAGAVLVYGGPESENYRMGKRGHDSTGTTLGHVTIKGKEGFYTDGKETNPAGANRHLVGVYVMSTCKNCSKGVKEKCASAGETK